MSGIKAFVGARIFDGAVWHDGKVLLTSGGHVTAISHKVPAEAEVIDANGLLIAPGFIDLQVNGGGGVMFNNQPDVDGIARICSAHAKFGTTALMITLITDRPDVTSKAAQAGIAASAANVPGFLGLHFEGPHLSVARKGTHDPALIRKMEAADLEVLTRCKAELAFVLTTIAPENVTVEQVTALRKAGIVVSLGHTDSGLDVATAYAEAGASMVTHLFNAMSPLGHREPGLVGAALSNGKLDCGLIADGFHVDPAAMGIALRAKNGPGRIFLVTDAMSTIGTDDDGFELNGRRVYRNGGRLTLADGTLAGADIDMLSCIRFIHEKMDMPLEEALRMASTYPAKAIGATAKGKLQPGSDADFVVLTPDLQMHSTWIGGEKIHDAARSGASTMIVCFDIGGTTIKGAIAYAPDDIRPVPRIPTPKTSFEDFAAGLKSVIDNSGGTPACVSLSIAGVIDPDTGKATVANIPSIHGRVLKDELEKALNLPVIVSNDADCFVIAESEIGSGQGHRVVFGVILGTGVGGGLVIDGRLINSDGGFAGEWGHGPVAATLAGNPPVALPRFECGCGLTGCVDAIGSARGMEKLHLHLHQQEMTSEDIISAWQAGDAQAARTIDILVDILASPLAMVINVTGATIVPVGGGLSNSRELLAALDEAVRSRVLRRFNRPLVVPAICRIEPGLIGSAVIGLKYEKEIAVPA